MELGDLTHISNHFTRGIAWNSKGPTVQFSSPIRHSLVASSLLVAHGIHRVPDLCFAPRGFASVLAMGNKSPVQILSDSQPLACPLTSIPCHR